MPGLQAQSGAAHSVCRRPIVNFTDPTFLALLPGFILLLCAVRWLQLWRMEKLILIVAGCLLLFTYGSIDVVVFVSVGAANYVLASTLTRLTGKSRRVLLFLILALDLSCLAYFKYLSFLLGTLPGFFKGPTADAGVVIPLGISFYTFHVISYQIDLHERRIEHASPIDFALYLSLFPHLIAGPIVRGAQLIPQIARTNERRVLFSKGVLYFIIGMFLKRFCADHIGTAIDPFWREGTANTLSTPADWTVLFLYYCQIYSDFAGYSSMAIGMAHFLGYAFPENFLGPMTACSLREFWRRWHVTLSSWLRDYVYIPLGGNRRGLARIASSLLITMVLGGLWHGAGWTFVAWGAIHGACLCVERLAWSPDDRRPRWSLALGLILTQVCVVATWVFFRAPGFEVADSFLRGIAGLTNHSGNFPRELSTALPLSLPVVAHNMLGRIGQHRLLEVPVLAGVICGVLLVLIIAYPSSSVLFIYYRF